MVSTLAAALAVPSLDAECMIICGERFVLSRAGHFGLVVQPLEPVATKGGLDHLEHGLLSSGERELFYTLVDKYGFVLCRGIRADHETYRFVRGRSSPGKLSPGEYFHHDGCSGPTKPRIVEIRFPAQATGRHISTAIAHFPEVVLSMAECFPGGAAAIFGESLPDPNDPAISYEEWEQFQAVVMRAARRNFSAAEARAYLRAVDEHVGAYVHRWQGGDSLFVANENMGQTYQHRRAYPEAAFDGRPNGNLVKRWPVEDLAGIAMSCEID